MTRQYANDFTRTVEVYYNELKKYKPMTRVKEKRLLKQCKKGNVKAKNEILEANLRFVFDIAKHYTGHGVPISELISEGNMGLLRAIDKFDDGKDVKFISYAVWWIRQAMLEVIKKRSILNMVEIESNKANDSVIDKKFSDDSNEVYDEATNSSITNEDDEINVERYKNRKLLINEIIGTLNERERDIIENYYGINTEKELTLLEIGKKYNLSIERVRQIKKQSLKKLRSKMLLLDEFEDLMFN